MARRPAHRLPDERSGVPEGGASGVHELVTTAEGDHLHGPEGGNAVFRHDAVHGAGRAVDERHDPHPVALRRELSEGCFVGCFVDHPTREGGAAVIAVAGIAGDDGAGSRVEVGPPTSRFVDRDHDGWQSGDAGSIEQVVDECLVLEAHPLGTAVGDDVALVESACFVEEAGEHNRLPSGIELRDGGKDLRWRVLAHRPRMADGVHQRPGGPFDGDDLSVGLGASAEPLGAIHEDLGRTRVPDRCHLRRPIGGRTADRNHAASADELGERLLPPAVVLC
jgi:hypothetical protein